MPKYSSLAPEDSPLAATDLLRALMNCVSAGLPPEQIEADNPLWRFAVSLWQKSVIVEAALALQADGWVVSHLLVAAYLAQENRAWDGREPEGIRTWRTLFTQHLRQLRQAVPKDRPDATFMRRSLATAELEAERIELAWWHQWLQQAPPGAALSDSQQDPLALLAHNLGQAVGFSISARPYLLDFAQGLASKEQHGALALELQAAINRNHHQEPYQHPDQEETSP